MKIAHNYFVYIVECADKSYYTGVTNDIDRRIWEHNNDVNALAYTYKRRPVLLKYYQRFQDINQAIAWEKQLKGWSRKKKEALFIDNWEEIKRLAKSKSSKSPPSTSSG
ncbi:MAG: GIY-YIG nuclease family protein [Ferruginibacter sp.]|nr:GIY-YIG nuclease family protein [Ferruginibacter sp.]